MDDFENLDILQSFVKLINLNLDISKSDNLELIIKKFPDMEIYKRFHLKKSKESNKDPNLDSLLFMNLLLIEFHNYIARHQEKKSQTHKFRLGAVGKITLRLIEITDENLALLRNGYGTSVISNLRLMLEAYAIARYLIDSDDIESDRFQDFGIVQECGITNNDPAEKLKTKNYPDSFLKPKSDFAWVSDSSLKSPIDFIKRLNDSTVLDWYKYTCKYVHSSPYACGKVFQMNQQAAIDNEYMPLDMKVLIQQNKYYIYLFIELASDNFIDEHDISDFYKGIARLIHDFKK